ncbi:MAG: glycosyltransferase family A protein [Thermodesulfobacteriota bacterium]|nr:glycosyltransferase family A protein [Thermodesulfobacteriota bacterium]
MPLVSVIIPTFNRAQKVVRAISSVLFQTFSDYDIIVVDDGSQDNTEASVARFHGPISYIARSTNRGVSAARNRGVLRSTGPLVAFLDSDDYWLPEKLAIQTAFMESNPGTDICQTEEIWLRKGRRVNPKKRHLKPSGDIFEPSLKLCLVSPSAVMMRRSLLDKVGLFDEQLPACEDYDLWLRICCNHRVELIKKALVVKEGGHPDQLSSRYFGMDRFRIRALEKLIKSGPLSNAQLKAAFEELSYKCEIYGKGCLKRGKNSEGAYYLGLPGSMKKELASLNRNPCYGQMRGS